MNWRVRPIERDGSAHVPSIRVPGDKSISHRALMLAALAEGRSTIRNLAPGADVRSTASCLGQLGVSIAEEDGTTVVDGGSLVQSANALDCGNSGTTMRLLSGILAGKPFSSELTGDGSLRQRPMRRVAEPLTLMGATVDSDDGRAPLRIRGGNLHGITFRPETPSAQVKSCVLLAALFADGQTTVVEPVKTRDHTERMLAGAGVELVSDNNVVTVRGGQRPHPFSMEVPGDFSSAAFFLALGATVRPVSIEEVGINATRTAFLDVLERFGAEICMSDQRYERGRSSTGGRNEPEVPDYEFAERQFTCGEPVTTATVEPSTLTGVEIGPDEAPLLIDELPLVAFLGSVASGTTRVTGAAELRVKESDRIAAVVGELRKLGAVASELDDGFVVKGGHTLRGAVCDSHGDHRIAMMLAVAGSVAEGDTIIRGVECVDISFPGFAETMRTLGAHIEPA